MNYSFADSTKYNECLVDGHEWEYLQSHNIDRSTREDEYFCVKCNITISDYEEIPREEIDIEIGNF